MAQTRPISTEALPADIPGELKLKLLVSSGPDAGAELLLERGTYRIGQDPSNELVLTDPAISRTHLVVEVLAGSVRVTDNGSTNGSFVGDSRFTVVEMKPNAVIRLGRTELKLVPSGSSPPAPASKQDHFGALFGASLKMRQTFALLERIAPSDSDVLLFGETGTGKELCADAIHAASARARRPFVVCDLSGITPSLFESELFGHLKGSFTGAHADRIGALERAHQGTLFLDEVGELPLELQPRLLRFLEKRQVKRVGANDYQLVDVRVVAATHKNLRDLAAAGRFREDLYHRLSVITLTLPPLRDRREDIPLLIDRVLEGLGKQHSQLSPETRTLMAGYDWPGNVRELRNVVERALTLGGQVELEGPAAAASSSGTAGLNFKQAKERLVTAFERDYLRDLLGRCHGNISRAAREAGIDRVHMHRLLRKHGLEDKG